MSDLNNELSPTPPCDNPYPEKRYEITPEKIRKILFITVGGSSRPICDSIQQNRPDLILFICSDDISFNPTNPQQNGSWHAVIDPGTPCDKKTKPNILKQTEYTQDYELVKITEFDNLGMMIQTLNYLARKIISDHPEAQLVFDYTGGTKTMSAALTLVYTLLKQGLLCVSTGTRRNLDRIQDGDQTLQYFDYQALTLPELHLQIKNQLMHYNFGAAEIQIKAWLKIPNLPPPTRQQLTRWLTLTIGLEAWHTFQHKLAEQKLGDLLGADHPVPKYLHLLTEELELLHKIPVPQSYTQKNHNYWLIPWELFQNATRLAKQQRFDDAVARLYRTIEVIIQITLRWEFNLSTGAIPPDQMPMAHLTEEIKQRLQGTLKDGYYKVGLMLSFEILKGLQASHPIAQWYDVKTNHEALKKNIDARNQSILAHGFRPVNKSHYNDLARMVKELLHPQLQGQAFFVSSKAKKKTTFTCDEIDGEFTALIQENCNL